MEITEKELENMIVSANRSELASRGFRDCSQETILRQLNLGAYGIADMVGFRITPGVFSGLEYQIVVYELKKDQIGLSALGQACRYISGIKAFIDGNHESISHRFSFLIVLVGSYIETSSDFVYLSQSCVYPVKCYEYSFGFHGLNFIEQRVQDYGPVKIEQFGFGDLPKLDLKSIYKKSYGLLRSI